MRALAFLLAAWLGATIFMAASVAPAAFAVLPSRTLAGALVGRILPPLFFSGLVLGVLSTALGSGWRRAAGATMAVACALAQFWVDPRIDRLRALPESDPRRIAFGRLHGLSVALLGVAMIAALLVIWRSYGQYSR